LNASDPVDVLLGDDAPIAKELAVKVLQGAMGGLLGANPQQAPILFGSGVQVDDTQALSFQDRWPISGKQPQQPWPRRHLVDEVRDL